LELQRDSYLDHARRTRFYSSMVDSEMLQKGKDYSELPDLTIFYISEKDIWRGTYTIYDLMKTLNNSADDYEDGIRIVYVNASVNDNSEIARLMQYFKTADPNDKRFGPLSERVHFLKCEKEGVEIMCRIEEQIKEIGLEIGKEIGKEIGRDLAMKEVVVRMSKRGKSVSEIVDDTGVELDRAQMWMKEAMSAI